MVPKTKGVISCGGVLFDTRSLLKFYQDSSLLVYTVLMFFVVIVIYIVTKDWKGYASPEEVDLGSVVVPHTCRQKHGHYRNH